VVEFAMNRVDHQYCNGVVAVQKYRSFHSIVYQGRGGVQARSDPDDPFFVNERIQVVNFAVFYSGAVLNLSLVALVLYFFNQQFLGHLQFHTRQFHNIFYRCFECGRHEDFDLFSLLPWSFAQFFDISQHESGGAQETFPIRITLWLNYIEAWAHPGMEGMILHGLFFFGR
jgi:hypothetical protein